MPWRPAETMMSEEMTCEQRPTLKSIFTYVAAVQWLITSTVKLEHKQHKEMDNTLTVNNKQKFLEQWQNTRTYSSFTLPPEHGGDNKKNH